MKATIWKYQLGPVRDRVELEMPHDARPLCVQVQDDQPCLWALVRPGNAPQRRVFHVYGTGHPVPVDYLALNYIGTFQIMSGRLVFHVFEAHGAAPAERPA